MKCGDVKYTRGASLVSCHLALGHDGNHEDNFYVWNDGMVFAMPRA